MDDKYQYDNNSVAVSVSGSQTILYLENFNSPLKKFPAILGV